MKMILQINLINKINLVIRDPIKSDRQSPYV